MNIEQAKARALEVRQMYPNLMTVEDIIDSARLDGVITDKNEVIIIWARLHRVIRDEEGVA
jgi:hypothetical protein